MLVFRLKVIPRLKKFKPDLIFISAGFDGHESEMINSGYVQLVNFNIITNRLILITDLSPKK